MRGATVGSLLALVMFVPAVRADDDVDALVARLGSARFKDRDAAMLALEKHGPAALKALQGAAGSPDPEIRERAALLLRRIELREEIARAIGGKKLRLVYKDVPVFDALLDFSAKAGVTIDVDGDRLGVRGRTITLDTGEVTLWEALDLFCARAGLRERAAAPTAKPLTRIALEDSKAAALPTAYHGALRLRAVSPAKANGTPPATPTPPAVGFLLEVTPEPKMPWHGVVSLRIHRAVDEHGQALVQQEPEFLGRLPDPFADGTGGTILIDEMSAAVPAPRQLAARLQPGQRAATVLKEVQGIVTVQVLAPQKLVTIRDVAECAGKEFKAADGTTVCVNTVERKNGTLTLTLHVRGPEPGGAGRVVRVRRAKDGTLVFDRTADGLSAALFDLTDGQGLSLKSLRREESVTVDPNGQLSLEVTLTFPCDKAGDPCTLTFTAPRPLAVDVPFTLRNVPLIADPQTPLAPAGATPLILTR